MPEVIAYGIVNHIIQGYVNVVYMSFIFSIRDHYILYKIKFYISKKIGKLLRTWFIKYAFKSTFLLDIEFGPYLAPTYLVSISVARRQKRVFQVEPHRRFKLEKHDVAAQGEERGHLVRIRRLIQVVHLLLDLA